MSTERITREHTPREVRPFRVYGQPTGSRGHWHVHKSSLPEEENKGDTSEIRARDPRDTSRARCHAPPPLGYVESSISQRYRVVALTDLEPAREARASSAQVRLFRGHLFRAS